jgi:hypothetical protein
VNFDVAIKGDFAVAAAVINDCSGNIITVATLKFDPFMDQCSPRGSFCGIAHYLIGRFLWY